VEGVATVTIYEKRKYAIRNAVPSTVFTRGVRGVSVLHVETLPNTGRRIS